MRQPTIRRCLTLAFRRGILLLPGLLWALGLLPARATTELSPGREANLRRVEAVEQERRAAAAGADHLLVRRGLIADRKERRVLLDAEATGLDANGIVEFPVIAEHSAHDYEALFIAFAKPSDVREALAFIGIPPGRPVDFSRRIFWPKGERVVMTAGRPGETARPVEDFILDVRSPGKPTLPRRGFIHAGSVKVERDGQALLAADGDGPGSIVSSYNEPTTVLDMPRQAMQGEVYERFVANPATLLPKEAFVEIVLHPEERPPEHPQRVVDLVLSAASPPGITNLAGAVFRLSKAGDDAAEAPAVSLADALRGCRQILPDRDPYVTLDLDDSLSLRTATELARILATLDNEDGLRLEPPREGQLFYKAFLPQDAWRNRKDRPTQPCELRFTAGTGGAVAATLLRIEEIWNEKPDDWRPTLKLHETPLPGPDALPDALAATGVKLPVLLVFAPGGLKLGDVMPYLRTVEQTHPNQHVFLEPAEEP